VQQKDHHMSSSRLAAHLAEKAASDSAQGNTPNSPPDTPGEVEGGTASDPKSDPKEKNQVDEAEHAAAVAQAREEAEKATLAASTTRMNAVFASEHYAGREAAANRLLGKPNLTAEDITEMLADLPKTAPAAALTEEQQRAAAEEAGREEMRKTLASGQNSNVDANNGGGSDPKADARKASDAVWAKAHGIKE
jgi:hypothetical protein